MKASLRDHLTIVMAFAAMFLCGYGIGQLVAKRQAPAAASPAAWEVQSLSILKESLALSPEETAIVESEIAATASNIRASRSETILAYHQHLYELYQRLIVQLGEPGASRLRQEQQEIEKAIQNLKTSEPHN